MIKTVCENKCDNCIHCCAVVVGGWDFECLADVCEKKDPHFKYSANKPDTPCQNFEDKNGKNG